MKQDRFLLGIVVGSIALVAIAVGVALSTRLQPQSIPDDTPDGVAYNYFLALQRDEQRTAYQYLSRRVKSRIDDPQLPFQGSIKMSALDSRMRVDNVTVEGERALLRVTVFTSYGGGLFGGRNESSYPDTVTLVREDGAWKIDRFFFPYWDTRWN
jgi:hypothetical protein